MFGSGVLPAHFRALAEAAGLAMWRLRNAGIAALTDMTPPDRRPIRWIAIGTASAVMPAP